MAREQAHEVYDDAIRGEDIPPDTMNLWNAETIVRPGSGSQNWGTLHAANRVFWGYHHNHAAMHDCFDAWVGYGEDLRFTTTETFTCHVYLPWILSRVAGVHGLANKVGRQDVAAALLPHLQTFRAVAALSSGWQRLTTGPKWLQGWPSVMTGARSFASYRGENGEKRYPDGRPHEPWSWMVSQGTFAGHMLAKHLGYNVAEGDALVLQDFLGADHWEMTYGCEQDECAALRRIVRNDYTQSDIALALDLINDGPGFAIPAEIVRTTDAIAWLNPKSINAGSTHFMYFKVWFEAHRPLDSYWEQLSWNTDVKVGWGAADDSMRKNGRSGKAELVERSGKLYARCQNNDGTWHHIDNGDRQGWFEAEIPGDVELHIRLNRLTVRGPNAEVVTGDVTPPEPGGEMGGVGRIRAAQKSLERAETRWQRPGGKRQAEKAIRQINQALNRRQ